MKLFLNLAMMVAAVSALAGCEAMHEKGAMKTHAKGTAKAGEVSSHSVTCTKGKESRSIESRMAEKGGCAVIYTKGGEAQTVASGKAGSSYCGQVVEKMKGKLLAAGWTCE